MKKIAIILSFVFLCSVHHSVFAESIKTFGASFVVHQDSTVSVSEKILYDSEGVEKHGIFRTIPVKSATGVPLHISNVSITNEQGIPYQFQETQSNGTVEFKIGDPNRTFHGQKTYVLQYTVSAAIGYFKTYDELYWNVTGNGWQFPIDITNVSVSLPQNAAILQEACYVGVAGSSERCTIVDGTVSYTQPLAPGEGITIAVGFPKGIVAEPTPWQQHRGIILLSLVPILLTIILYIRWRKYGRDPKGTGVLVPQYDVPDMLTPAQVGIIVTQKFKNTDIAAELIYLATQGYIKIKQTEDKILGIFNNKDYTLTLLKDPVTLPKEMDRLLLQNLFSGSSIGSTVALSSMRNTFYRVIPKLSKALRADMLLSGYYKNLPKASSAVTFVVVWVLIILAFPILIPLMSAGPLVFGAMQLPYLIIVMFVSIAIVVLFNRIMPAKTAHGVAIKEHIDGLKQYLQIAEKDRLEFHNAPEKKPETFEQLLPYAMVLGVEKAWAKEFADLYVTPPSWYEGEPGSFNSITFVQSLHNFSAYSVSSLTSMPGGSGSGGGGSSGGGGGGGGGGSW